MPDDKRGRDKHAHDEEKRQREREVLMELERADETEPPVESAQLDALETELDSVTFPATGAEIVTAAGDFEVDSADETHRVETLIPETETFDSPATVSVRVRRPTVATAMKRVVEAADQLPRTNLARSQRNGYEKTFRALKAIDADDDDEGIAVIADWIVEQITEEETLPSSRDVRRKAAKFCRSNDYDVRDDEWLGV